MAEISKLGIEIEAKGFGKAKSEMQGLTREVEGGSKKMSQAFSGGERKGRLNMSFFGAWQYHWRLVNALVAPGSDLE